MELVFSIYWASVFATIFKSINSFFSEKNEGKSREACEMLSSWLSVTKKSLQFATRCWTSHRINCVTPLSPLRGKELMRRGSGERKIMWIRMERKKKTKTESFVLHYRRIFENKVKDLGELCLSSIIEHWLAPTFVYIGPIAKQRCTCVRPLLAHWVKAVLRVRHSPFHLPYIPSRLSTMKTV